MVLLHLLAAAALAQEPVLFRPREPVAAALRQRIDAATVSVHAALYQLDLVPLAEALLRARSRGADVRLVLDAGALSPRGPQGEPLPTPRAIRLLQEGGVPVRTLRGRPPHGSMHAKFAVFDRARAVDGSYNWTTTAETLHFENLEFLEAAGVVRGLEGYFEWLWCFAGAAEKESVASHPTPACGHPSREREGGEGGLYLSPEGGAEAAIAEAMRGARRSIDVAMFSFYSFAIARRLVAAHLEGVAVRVVLDLDQARASPVTAYLRRKGVPVRFLAGPGGPGPHSRMHHKFALFDSKRLENGSFNFSPNAEKRSFETVRFSTEAARVAAFAAEFQRLWQAGQK